MDHGFVAPALGRARSNFAGIAAAPDAFLLAMIITIGVSYLAFHRVQAEQLAVVENKIAEREALITEYRGKLNRATNEIEKLTKALADAQTNMNEARTKAALLEIM